MKRSLGACLALVLGASTLLAVTVSPVRISVVKDQETDRDSTRRGNTSTSVCSRDVVLQIKLQNLQGGPATNWSVGYTIVAREKTVRALKVVGQGEQQVSIRPLQTVTVRTEPVSFQTSSTRSTYKACCGATMSMRSASGTEYHGVGVTVKQGGRTIATHFEPPSLERELPGLLNSPAMSGRATAR